MTTVVTNGCFDLFHPGHLEFLARCAELGDRLIVGVNSDASVRRLKGSGRPIYPQEARLRFVASLNWVHGAFLFDDEEELIGHLRQIQPDVLAKGGDWQGRPISGAAHAGRVEFVPRDGRWSTTEILRRLRGTA
jgi:rfaE bifunctional protein nucleotidyltransferase chain/domain